MCVCVAVVCQVEPSVRYLVQEQRDGERERAMARAGTSEDCMVRCGRGHGVERARA